jgi:Spy/CpxP family protein refolding chaperone
MGPQDSISDLMRPDVQKELAMTAEQCKKLDDVRFNSEKESIQNRAVLQIQRLELSRLLDSETPDRQAIDKKIQEVAQAEAALLRSSINARLSVRALLTAEQRTKLASFMRNRANTEWMPAEAAAPPRQPAPRAGQPRERLPLPVAPDKPQAK